MRAPRLAVVAAVAFVTLSAATPVASLEVGIDHVRSNTGLLRVCLTADPDNFPGCVNDALAVTRNIAASARVVRFEGLPAGTVAVAVIHDENRNGRLDTFAGVPREGYGFSRNAAIRFGPPNFAAARFAISGDANAQQVRMRYIL